MTLQETFDTVANHLAQQKCKAVSNINGECLYRVGNLKCAAGCLIPDERYNPEMEGEIVLSSTAPGKVLEALGHNLTLCANLQIIHDNSNPEDWARELKLLAEAVDLTFDYDAFQSELNRTKVNNE